MASALFATAASSTRLVQEANLFAGADGLVIDVHAARKICDRHGGNGLHDARAMPCDLNESLPDREEAAILMTDNASVKRKVPCIIALPPRYIAKIHKAPAIPEETTGALSFTEIRP